MPLTDLPMHLAVASVLGHPHDPTWGFDRYFVVEGRELTPYWTYYVLLVALGRLMPLEIASRVVLTACVIPLPLAAVALCRAFDRPAWAGLLAAPLALGANLYFGFVSYCLGIVLALVALALTEGERRQPRAGRAWVLALLGLLLFFTHAQALAWVLGAALLAVAIASGPAKPRFRALLPLVPGAVLLGAWCYAQFVGPRQGGHDRYNFGRLGEAGARFSPFRQDLAALPDALAGSFQDGSDNVLLALWAGLMLALIARREAGRGRVGAVVAFTVACYFLAPTAITGQWYINERFAFPAALLLVLLVPAGAPSRLGTAGALALTGLTAANAAWHHARFDREAAGFAAVLEALPERPRVLGLMFSSYGRVLRRWPYLHFEQYAMVRRGGVAGNSLAKSPPFPIRHHSPDAFPAPSVFRPDWLDAAKHLPRYDFLLVRGVPPHRLGLDRYASRVLRQGDWQLWAVDDFSSGQIDRRGVGSR